MSFKMFITFCLLNCCLLMKLIGEVSSESNIVVIETNFDAMAPGSLLPGVPKRLLDPGWSDVRDPIKCALRSRANFANSRGFLYNKDTGLCTPLLWLEGRNANGATELQAHEGDIYIDSSVCPVDFQIYGYDSDTSLACLRKSTDEVNYFVANTTCASWGGFLASCKTTEKMDLVRTFVSGEDIWIGLNDIDEEGTYVWHEDGEVMTTDQFNNLFGPGEPNNANGNQHCIEYNWDEAGLDDKYCDKSGYDEPFLCEMPVPS